MQLKALGLGCAGVCAGGAEELQGHRGSDRWGLCVCVLTLSKAAEQGTETHSSALVGAD